MQIDGNMWRKTAELLLDVAGLLACEFRMVAIGVEVCC